MEYLAFERPIAELEKKIEELQRVGACEEMNLTEEVVKLSEKSRQLTQKIFSRLEPSQIVSLARHPNRPYTQDYINHMLTDFYELHGDRHGGQGRAIVAGIGRLQGQSVMVIGHQKGRNTKEKVYRNFGMANPEGFRKALRLMKLAERFGMPIITLIDTPGAYPGIAAEEQNQSEAIARNLFEMSTLTVPVICVVIGEGCSGGALAIGVGDRTLMLQYAYYSVISPEGCASILWKSAERANQASEALHLTSKKLLAYGLIDEVVAEPLGGAHRDHAAMAAELQARLTVNIQTLKSFSPDVLQNMRYERWMKYGLG